MRLAGRWLRCPLCGTRGHVESMLGHLGSGYCLRLFASERGGKFHDPVKGARVLAALQAVVDAFDCAAPPEPRRKNKDAPAGQPEPSAAAPLPGEGSDPA